MQNMGAAEWVRDAVIIAVGAFLLWNITNSFVSIYPGYSYYGWGIMGAYFAGAVLYLRRGLRGGY